MAMDLKAGVGAAIAQARNLPADLARLERINPALAEQLESKPLLASRTPWGTLAAAAVGWASARFGLGLDAHATDLVAGAALVGGSYAMRAITSRPIAGILRGPGVPTP